MSKGFTLIELLISITIVGVILVIILGALRIGVRAWEAGERDIDNNQRLQIVLTLINQQLSSVCWDEIKREGADSYYFGGRKDFVEFISDVSIVPGKQFGKVYVVYRIQSDDNDHMSLQVAEQSLGKISPDTSLFELTDEDFHKLISDVYDMSFEFLIQTDQGDLSWADEFEAKKENGLPKAVRFVLRMSENSPPVAIVARVTSEQDKLQTGK